MKKLIHKKFGKKGFTLAELLIVVAIIAVLVAIAIPIFTSQLEKSREAVDLSNARAAYAEVMVAALNGDTGSDVKASVDAYTLREDAGVYTAVVTCKQAVNGWQTSLEDLTIGGIAVPDEVKAKGTITITYNPNEEEPLTIVAGD